MDLYEFNFLNQDGRADSIWKLGKYIKTIELNGLFKALYLMEEFFAEISFTPENGIIEVQGFKSKNRLLPYKNIGLPLLLVKN